LSYSVWLRAWQVQVGRVKLYLLDSNGAANVPAHRGITSELYGGGQKLRIQQEIAFGIGGWRLLRTLGLHPEVCHLNEGHAAFGVLERARSFMQAMNWTGGGPKPLHRKSDGPWETGRSTATILPMMRLKPKPCTTCSNTP
jgi:glucan phosphorylase